MIIASSDGNAQGCERCSQQNSGLKDLVKLKHFLGTDFDQCVKCVKMTQKRYVERVLKRFNMQDCKKSAQCCTIHVRQGIWC